MHVREAMSKAVLIVGPGHTLRQTAQLMSQRRVGSAVVNVDWKLASKTGLTS